MGEKSVGIAAVLAATIFMAVFATAMTLNMNYAEGQIIVPTPGRTPLPASENRTEENIVCSGFSYTCG